MQIELILYEFNWSMSYVVLRKTHLIFSDFYDVLIIMNLFLFTYNQQFLPHTVSIPHSITLHFLLFKNFWPL